MEKKEYKENHSKTWEEATNPIMYGGWITLLVAGGIGIAYAFSGLDVLCRVAIITAFASIGVFVGGFAVKQCRRH